ncbi:hypothetical protein [Lysinibacillus sp. 3P01SB]|uniref:hypothetical protein n=1 Tax=Lysinibacillus sp. 3P01SB TaxID=3132284 RepID=UPI0039A40405
MNEDLSYKANSFITKIQELRQLGGELQSAVQQETSEQMGDIIEAINESIQTKEKMNEAYHDAYEVVMKNMASHYSNHIMEMNSQKLTLYYEIIENKK